MLPASDHRAPSRRIVRARRPGVGPQPAPPPRHGGVLTDEPQPAQSLAHADGAPSVDAPTPGRGSDGLGRLLDAAIAVFVAAYTLRGIGPHVRNAATRVLWDALHN